MSLESVPMITSSDHVNVQRTRMPKLKRHLSYINPKTQIGYLWTNHNQEVTIGYTETISKFDLENKIPSIFEMVYKEFIEQNPDLQHDEHPKFNWSYSGAAGGRAVLWIQFPTSGMSPKEKHNMSDEIVPPYYHYLDLVDMFARRVIAAGHLFCVNLYGSCPGTADGYSVDAMACQTLGLFACMALFPNTFHFRLGNTSKYISQFQTRLGVALYLFSTMPAFISVEVSNRLLKHTYSERETMAAHVAADLKFNRGTVSTFHHLTKYIFELKENVTAETLLALLPEHDTDEAYPRDCRLFVVSAIERAFST